MSGIALRKNLNN